jgi:hypothetical protein
LLKKVRETLPEIIGEKANNLVAEGNYYYDISKCGIGFHGDAIRTGATLPLHFQYTYTLRHAAGEKKYLK